ncbi:broad-complex core protein isoforms 1/2/3/4/5-like [Schistocerca gregaria]|uniref:broad-complex core protein isoforms 1/2/3/4/5-like n=1 Tax=Schistocerca gregaria TaxID=7010 RepID=UPI00211EF2AC|nr:broad-complex core protein isoforms 1/2/3/4/5-like [Schistocerca gregaria]
MGGNKLLVRWEQHESSVMAHLRRLLAAEAFVDVTLCCQGRRLRAHRVLLSACSPYLQRMLLEHPCGIGEPVTVILQDVNHEDMRRLLDLMYTGSTEVPGYDLPRFLCVAQALDVTLLQSAAIRICEVTTSPSAQLATEPIPITTPAVPVSPPKAMADPSGPPPNEPSLSHCHSLLLASQLRNTDVGQQAPSTGTPMPSPPCWIAMPPSTPPPTTAHSPIKGAEQPVIQPQFLQVPHCCPSEPGSSLPTFTFLNMSPSAVSKHRRIQPWIQQDCCTEQGNGTEKWRKY